MISVVLPTFNEAQNLPIVAGRIASALRGRSFEIIIVDDDSPDKTWQVAEKLAKEKQHVRVIRRIGRRGLSTAVMEGFHYASGDVLVVMDADGQHDPLLLPKFEDAVLQGATMVVGSRYVRGGGTGEWRGRRRFLSRAATVLTTVLLGVHVSDPMSGFFAIRRDVFRAIAPGLKSKGFKILLDLLVRLPSQSAVREIPYTFATRLHGESKLSLSVQFAFLWTLLGGLRRRLFAPRNVWAAFIGFLVASGIALVPRAWDLCLLATDVTVRHRAAATIRTVADQRGWLISDITVLSVTPAQMQILHQFHGRFESPSECLNLSLTSPDVTPCDAL